MLVIAYSTVVYSSDGSYPKSMQQYFGQRTPQARQERARLQARAQEGRQRAADYEQAFAAQERPVDYGRFRQEDIAAYEQMPAVPLHKQFRYLPQQYTTDEMTAGYEAMKPGFRKAEKLQQLEAYEQNKPGRVDNALPQRSWRDYLGDSSGLRSDLYRARRYGSSYIPSWESVKSAPGNVGRGIASGARGLGSRASSAGSYLGSYVPSYEQVRATSDRFGSGVYSGLSRFGNKVSTAGSSALEYARNEGQRLKNWYSQGLSLTDKEIEEIEEIENIQKELEDIREQMRNLKRS